MNIIESIAKKTKTLLETGIDPLEVGEHYFNNPDPEVEELAKKRLDDCFNCLETEPLKRYKIIDEKIPELSEKSCNKCGCIAPFKFRQSINKCKKWQQ